jgi:regulatory protein
MKIISIKAEYGSDMRKAEFQDGTLLSFRICYLPEEANHDAEEGSEISAEEEAGFRFASACLRAEKIALRLIARAEQTSFGLTRKLIKRRLEAACVNAVLSRLCELELIDDSRFARLWLESRLRLTRSPRRLLSALAGRGISHEDAEAALKTVLDEETEFALLSRFVKKYSPKMEGRSLKYLLKSEGFSPQAIQQYLEDSD